MSEHRSESGSQRDRQNQHSGKSAGNRSERADHALGADYEVSFEEGTAQAGKQSQTSKEQ